MGITVVNSGSIFSFSAHMAFQRKHTFVFEKLMLLRNRHDWEIATSEASVTFLQPPMFSSRSWGHDLASEMMAASVTSTHRRKLTACRWGQDVATCCKPEGKMYWVTSCWHKRIQVMKQLYKAKQWWILLKSCKNLWITMSHLGSFQF